jgi:hypothetical protein
MDKRWEPTGNRRSLRHALRLLRYAKTWQLTVVLILCIFVSATFLRLNNLGMVQQRTAVGIADTSGTPTQIRQSLADLQHYASAHMNADPGVVYLQQSYNRDYAAAIATEASARNPNSDVYQQASIACRDRFKGGVASFRNDYVTCVAAAVSNLPTAQQQSVKLPNPSVYRYSFSSPLISLDFAGVSSLITFLLGMTIFLKTIGVIVLKFLIKRRHKII